MAFFRTKETAGDRTVDQGARAQRRQQQQTQQQLLDRERRAVAALDQPAHL